MTSKAPSSTFDEPPQPQVDTSWRQAALAAGATEHYEDPVLYDHEYRRRRDDIRWYRALAAEQARMDGGRSARGVPLRVLELGCGSGRLLVPLLRDGHCVVGVDRSAAMLARCAQRMARLGKEARLHGLLLRADMRALPLADFSAQRSRSRKPQPEPKPKVEVEVEVEPGGFSLIVCPFNGFMHLYTRHDVEQCLAEVRRLLRPGGLFALDVLNPDPAWLARDPLRRWSRTRFRHPGTGERLVYTTNHVYDPATQLAWIRIYYEPDPGPDRRPEIARRAADERLQAQNSGSRCVQLTHRQFYPAELEALFHYNGFTLTEHYGGFDGQPISPVSVEQVICARVR